MRIQRNRLTFRKRQRRSGCLSLAMLLGLLVSAVVLSWNWLGQRLSWNTSPAMSASLDAAQQAFARGDLNSAVDLAQQVLDGQPDDVNALTLLVRALIYRSYTDYNRDVDRQTALEITTEALSHQPTTSALQAIHAFALQAAGQPAQAAKIAQRLLDHDPNDALARLALGLSYGGVGSFDLALRETQRAAQQSASPWQMDTQRALGIAYSDLGNYTSAALSVENAIAQNTHLIPLYFERALYALQLGDADAATVAYFKILAYDPNNVKVRLRLCELSSTMRERDAATRYCTAVTQLAPDWSEGWYHLGREYFLQGNFALAQDNLHRCSTLQVMQNIPISQRRFECWYLQGQAAEIRGDCTSLVATYNEFREMAANNAIPQTWTYPPEGPPGCISATPTQNR